MGMDTDPISNRCPKCQSPLPADAPQGLCPKCLLAAVATPTEADQPAGRPTPPPLEEITAAFPQLEILEFFGQGGMGFVFKARQPKLDRLVALKILPQSLAADPTFAERFNREAKLLARLNHPGIVTVHDFGVAAGILPAVELGFQPGGRDIADTEGLEKSEASNNSNAIPGGKMSPSTSGRMPDATSQSPDVSTQTQFYYLLMEFVDGVNLRQAMQAGRFTPEQALAIVPKICEALQFAHNEGILHRDIKPENILLDAKGRVKIADFGIAKLVGDVAQASQPAGDLGIPAQVGEPAPASREQGCSPNPQAGKPALHALTEAGKALGTPNYMAPEQLENAGEVDHRADIYSLGVVFYEMLTGELPTGRFAPPSQKSTADPRVDEVVLRALEKEKAKRYASADEVRTQVETIAETQKGSGRESGLHSSGAEKPVDELPTFMPALYTVSWLTLCGTCFSLMLAALARGTGVWILSGMAASAMFAALAAVYTQRLVGPALRRKLLITHRGYEYVTAILLVALGFIATVAIVSGNRRSIDPDLWWWFSLVFMGLAVFAVWKFKQSGRTEDSVTPTPTDIGMTSRFSRAVNAPGKAKAPYKWKIAICVVIALLGATWFMAGRGRSYPASSLRSAYGAPVIGRIHFECSHPDAIAGGKTGTSYDVKAWGDTQWGPSFVLGGGRALMFKTRVDASRSAFPVAMVAVSSDNNHWEAKKAALGTNRSTQSLGFSNGLQMIISWSGVAAPAKNARRPSHIQQDVMLRASKLSDAKHPVSTADTSLLFGTGIERTLRFDMDSSAGWLDLDSGKYHQKDFPSASITATTNGGLAATHLVVIQSVGREEWETLTAEQVKQALGNAPFSGFTHDTGPLEDLPKVWLFKTFHGAMGILQLSGFTENPRGVKIRYKLMQALSQSSAASPSLAEQGRVVPQAPFIAQLPEGEVELLGVSEFQKSTDPAMRVTHDQRAELVNKVWWQPDGLPLSQKIPCISGALNQEGRDAYEVALRVRGQTNGVPGVEIEKLPDSGAYPGGVSGATWARRVEDMTYQQILSCEPGLKTVSFRIGVATEAWDTERAMDFSSSAIAGGESGSTMLAVTESGEETTATCQYDQRPGWQTRLIALGPKGEIKSIRQGPFQGVNDSYSETRVFRTADIKKAKLHLQRRPFRWVEFHNVSLKPGQPTQVEIRDAATINQTALLKEKSDWGEPTNGASVRLHVEKVIWQGGATPLLLAHIRNGSNMNLFTSKADNHLHQIELDGVWFRSRENLYETLPGQMEIVDAGELRKLAPGEEWEEVQIPLRHDEWQTTFDGDMDLTAYFGSWLSTPATLPRVMPPLPPGKHMVRVAFVVDPAGNASPFRVISNPVEIEIAGRVIK
jgi:serine/threonine protein kinase